MLIGGCSRTLISSAVWLGSRYTQLTGACVEAGCVSATPLRYASLRASARLWLQPRIDFMLERTSPTLTYDIGEGPCPYRDNFGKAHEQHSLIRYSASVHDFNRVVDRIWACDTIAARTPCCTRLLRSGAHGSALVSPPSRCTHPASASSRRLTGAGSR